MNAFHQPVVAIVGRPNVGKSTLFNRIIRERMAIVDDRPGITRDRLAAMTDWAGRTFLVVDTGGLVISEKADLISAIGQQARLAVQEADVVLLVVDLEVGPSLEDKEVARHLLRAGKKTLLVLNKSDTSGADEHLADFFSLGLGQGQAISSLHGRGVGDLLDRVVEKLPPERPEPTPQEGIQVAVLGRPNVGKSSLVNAIVGEERVVVDAAPGTTRDAVDTILHLNSQRFIFIDTAGLRRKSKITDGVEFYSTLRTLRGLNRCHVALVVIDAVQGPRAQDVHIVGQAQEAFKGIVMVLNKWDLVQEGVDLMAYAAQVKERYPSLSYVPLVNTSALKRWNVSGLLEHICTVYRERGRRISTGRLNSFVSTLVQGRQPPSLRGRPTKIYYAVQQMVHPPTFIFFTNQPGAFRAPYLRYIRHQLRSAFGFSGTPLRVWIRKRERKG
jgi:GTP-binding protein